jgi:type IV pilus assembly protein PilW
MKTPRRSQAGFTLVELMISMTLGLLIILALITMLISVNRNNNELGSSNRLIEGGRFTSQLLASELVHAGYWGGHLPNYDDLTTPGAPVLASIAGGQVPTALPEPCTAYDPVTWTPEHKANLIGIHVQGSDVTPGGTIPYCSTASVLTSAKPNTDVLVVRHVEPCLVGAGANECSNTLGAANPDVYFQASRCGTDTETFVLSTTGHGLHNRDCDTATPTLAPIRRFASSMYYVKDDGTNPPTLMRSVFQADGAAPKHLAAQPLVEGVEGFRLEFGIDRLSDTGANVTQTAAISWADPANKNSPTNRGDGIPDGSYVRCPQGAPCTPAQLVNAVAVKMFVLVRAERKTPGHTDTKVYKLGSNNACADDAAAAASQTCAPTMGPFNDGYKRHVFHQTVRLINVSGRRETP